MIIFLILVACTYPPRIWIPVDTTKISYLKFGMDYDDCIECARITWPCTESQMRAPIRLMSVLAWQNYRNQQAYVIDCLQRKGYRILKPGEIEYW